MMMMNCHLLTTALLTRGRGKKSVPLRFITNLAEQQAYFNCLQSDVSVGSYYLSYRNRFNEELCIQYVILFHMVKRYTKLMSLKTIKLFLQPSHFSFKHKFEF